MQEHEEGALDFGQAFSVNDFEKGRQSVMGNENEEREILRCTYCRYRLLSLPVCFNLVKYRTFHGAKLLEV